MPYLLINFSGMEFWGVCTGVGSGVEGYFGGDDAGVLNIGAAVIVSRKESSCFSDSALWSVSRGLMDGTPPIPSSTVNIVNILFRLFLC